MMPDKCLGNLQVKHGNSIVKLIKPDRLCNENEWACIQICLLDTTLDTAALKSDTKWSVASHYILLSSNLSSV